MKPLLRFFPTARALVAVGIAYFAGISIGHAAGFPSFDKLHDIGKTVDDVGRAMKGATGLSLEEEIAIGDAVSLEIVGRFGGVWRDEPAMWRVNLVGRTLSRFAERQDLTWRFGLLNSESINAFSAPGGRVFITRGLYEIIRSDDELAGVLAHEIAHIDRRHALKIIARGEFLGGVTALVADNNSDFSKYDEAVSAVTDNLIDKGYDSNSEFDADKEGRDLAKVTGFAPGGLRAVIGRLGEMEKDKSRIVFSTHPSPDKRLRKLPKDPPPPEPTPAPSS
jgi:predicted Zn-dependent protease